MIIKINKISHRYLVDKILCVSGNGIHVLDENKYNIFIELSDTNADKIRDLALDKLQIVGYDENYDLTKEGKIIEEIIDLFYQ